MSELLVIALLALLLAGLVLGADGKNKVWTDPAQAATEDPDFVLQGEYVVPGRGLQVAALGEGRFYLSAFRGGLPGAGWDRSAPEVSVVERAEAESTVSAWEKTERFSHTLGDEPPAGADVLVGENGVNRELVRGEEKDGLLWAGSQTTKDYGSFTLHLEFRLPYKPGAALSGQDRGNSGIYLQNRYEVQILDSFGLVYDAQQVKVPVKSDPKQWGGSLYQFKTADLPMCFPPLSWQTYDLDFMAPQFAGDGNKTADAVLTVRHNGKIIHDAVKLPKGTGAGGGRKEVPKGPIVFQGHGNPVAFRNVWIVEK